MHSNIPFSVGDAPGVMPQYFPLKIVKTWVPPARQGTETQISTLTRWILNGVKRFDGKIVRLKAIRMGIRWMVTREDFDAFTRKLTPILDEVETPGQKAKKPNVDRTERNRRDKEELAKLGI